MKEEDCVGRFPLATNETYTNKQTNERVTNTEWHNIVVRNKAAEICEKYLSKGDKVYIEGRIKTRKWQDDKGNDRYSTEIHCTDFTFLTTKKESEGISQFKISKLKNLSHSTMKLTSLLVMMTIYLFNIYCLTNLIKLDPEPSSLLSILSAIDISLIVGFVLLFVLLLCSA